VNANGNGNGNGIGSENQNLLMRHRRRIVSPVDVVRHRRPPPYGYSTAARHNCPTPSNNKRRQNDPSLTERIRGAKWAWLHKVGDLGTGHPEANEQRSWRTGRKIFQAKRAEFRWIGTHGFPALDRAPSVVSFDVGGRARQAATLTSVLQRFRHRQRSDYSSTKTVHGGDLIASVDC
jgi:hypothetical protein